MKPRTKTEWDEQTAIPTPLYEKMSQAQLQLSRIQLREQGLLDFEAALKGKKVKPCKKLEEAIDKLIEDTNELDRIVAKAARWLIGKRKATRKAKKG